MDKIKNRKRKEHLPVLAICYDFDKTLSPDDMQAQGFIQSVRYDVEEFWKESNSLAEKNNMDQNSAYMHMMVEKAKGKIVLTRKSLETYGAGVSLFSGVETWFDRIRNFGEEHGVIVEHYIISSGLKEMIEGTVVAKNGAFEAIYASSFLYDESNGLAKWPAQVINYTNKTQFLFRIQKGVLDINDDGVNDYFEPEDIRVPFRNMVYIGDSDTDVPCMKLVNSYGGHSIGVYNEASENKTKVYKMMRENRIKYFAPANYNEGSPLDELLKKIILRTAANEELEAIHYECKKERVEADKQNNEEARKKQELFYELECSRSFARTHQIISELQNYSGWTNEEKEILYEIAIKNNQVKYVLTDLDVKTFYAGLLKKSKHLSENACAVVGIIKNDK